LRIEDDLKAEAAK